MAFFLTGAEKGFYARVSRLGTQWLELDLHFLSLGGGEIALGWWFEECLVPYLVNTSKLEAVQSISIVTGYGKTRLRGARQGDDGMRKRVRAMLKFMNIQETPQPNRGRVHIDKQKLIEVVKHNGGRVVFDLEGYMQFKEEETTANKFPDVEQKVRPRYRPQNPDMGGPPFIRVETESTSAEFRRGDASDAMEQQVAPTDVFDDRTGGGHFPEENDGGRAGRYDHDGGRPGGERRGSDNYYDKRNSRQDERLSSGGRNHYDSRNRRGSYDDGYDRPRNGGGRRGSDRYQDGRRGGNQYDSRDTRRGSYQDDRGGGRHGDRRDSYRRNSFNDRRRTSNYSQGNDGYGGEDEQRRTDESYGRPDDRYNERNERFNNREQLRSGSTWEPPAGVGSIDHYGRGEGEENRLVSNRGAYSQQPPEDTPGGTGFAPSPAPVNEEHIQEASVNETNANGESGGGMAKKRNSLTQRGYSLEPAASKRARTS
jgi:hypothetical protein